jgi:hypothetical protein
VPLVCSATRPPLGAAALVSTPDRRRGGLVTGLLAVALLARPALAQQLRPIELREIQQWLRDGEPAASIGLRLTERCTPRRILPGTVGPLQQLGATPATLSQVLDLPLCPTIGAESGERGRSIGRGTYGAPEGGSTAAQPSRGGERFEFGAGLALASIHAWHTTTMAQSRRPNLIAGMGGVGPMATVQAWPVRRGWLSLGLAASVARTLYAGDGYGRTGFTWGSGDARAIVGRGRLRLAVAAGAVRRQGDRLRIDGRDTLEARVDFGGLRWSTGLVLGGSSGPATGLELSLTGEQSAPGVDAARGRPGARVRFADGPVFLQAELLAGAPPAGTPLTVLSGRPVALPSATTGGSWLLGGGVRVAWPRPPRPAR